MHAHGNPPLRFQAAVERPLNVVFQTSDGRWEGHDYRVEVITEREGLDPHDVVMDFRDLETALNTILEPLQHSCLHDRGLAGPEALIHHLWLQLRPHVPPDVHLAEVALIDGTGRRLALRP